MTDEEKEFLEKNFKAGEYSSVTILVRNKEMQAFLEYIANASQTLAVMPSASAMAKFMADDGDGNVQ